VNEPFILVEKVELIVSIFDLELLNELVVVNDTSN
jgi:hypothetical protein